MGGVDVICYPHEAVEVSTLTQLVALTVRGEVLILRPSEAEAIAKALQLVGDAARKNAERISDAAIR